MERRTFVLGSTAAAASSAIASKSANDTIRVAVLGVRSRGIDHFEEFQQIKNVEVAVLCDPDQQIAQKRAGEFEKKFGKPVRIDKDLRRVLDDKSIDVISIATPNHWHALATVWGCQAGKDVYVEKCGAHGVEEGRIMIRAAERYNRIVQHGVQLRSSSALRQAMEKIHGGLIGKVYMARAIVYRWRPSIGKNQPQPVPPYIDYNLWLGPAAERPFSRRYIHYNWHWQWDLGDGEIGNQGPHEVDMCIWGLGVKHPRTITTSGGKFLFDDDKETPEILTASYLYPDQGKTIEVEIRNWCTNLEDGMDIGNVFYGSEGILIIKGYDTYETYFGRKREPGPKGKGGTQTDHFVNFINAVRSRNPKDLNAPPETLHYTSSAVALANISYRVGRRLHFDGEAERFINDGEADSHLKRTYRAPFTMPKI